MRPWPKHLSKPAREWLAAIDRQYALDAHHRQVAIAGAEAWDRATQARKRIDADGLMRPDRFGIPKPHPLLIVERDNRGLFLRCVTALQLRPCRRPGRRPAEQPVGRLTVTSHKPRLAWPEILAEAATIVRGYGTSVTLRQLFYRLVASELLPNTRVAYQTLSHLSAQARRDGRFPPLIDRTRSINRYQTFVSPAEARAWLQQIYRRDRTEGQEHSIYLGVEKAGISEQLQSWFGDLGVPILALGGYSSQTYIDQIAEDVERERRPAVLIYAGDFDPSGEDILRDFPRRAAFLLPFFLHAPGYNRYHRPIVAFSSDSRTLAAFAHETITSIDVATATVRTERRLKMPMRSAAFDPAWRTIAMLGEYVVHSATAEPTPGLEQGEGLK